MTPSTFVRTVQEVLESVPEPGDDAKAGEIGLFLWAHFCRFLLSWHGLAVFAAVEAAAIAYEVLT